MEVKDLKPIEIWQNFAALNAVPRPSKKEDKVIQFMLDFGKSLGLETYKDKIGNVIIKKPATKGMEDRKTVILQSHLDMVHQKNKETDFDFDTQGIEMYVDGDWVKARGTTLGADNGIGVAAIMGILASNEIEHPPIEALFTIDEETGMTGAMELDGSLLSGEILLNLDTEDEDELSIGCAGGIDTNTLYEYKEIVLDGDYQLFEISIKGLLGGHSGMDIDKGRGNANKLMNRIFMALLDEKVDFYLVDIDGGSLRNAIPRESSAMLAVNSKSVNEFKEVFEKRASELREEFRSIEKEMEIHLKEKEKSKEIKAVEREEGEKIIRCLQAVFNGVFRMSPDIENLVEASSSLARVIVKNGKFETQSLQRSSVESSKKDVADTVKSVFDLIGTEVVQGGGYPGWQPNKDSEILSLMSKLYQEMFKEEPNIKACHAGLECGILLQHLPKADTISFGPNIRGAHSPDEKCQISSVQKFWDFLLEALRNIPKK